MARHSSGRPDSKPTKGRKADGKRVSAEMALPPGELDPDEVFKAMMALKKEGKRKESSSDSEGESTDDENQEESVKLELELDVADDLSDGSDAESSSMASERVKNNVRKRSRSASPVDEDHKPTLQRALPSRIGRSAPIKANVVDPFSAPKPPPTTTFASLGLSQRVINALGTINIRKPTEIQAACIGPIMQGRDCIGGAKTGSGKTLAFALPIIERILRDPFGVWAVILTPTRELAYQLTEQFMVVGRPAGLSVATIVGGMDMMSQARDLESRPHIIVATPGRLCDLLRSDGISKGKLSRVRCLVLDEADRMLTETFAADLAYLFSQMPPHRQTCLFTATISDSIMQLANRQPAPGKQQPFIYRIESDTLTVAGLKQKYLFIPSQVRDPYLLYLLRHPPGDIDAALKADPKKEKEKQRREMRALHNPKKKRSRKAEPAVEEGDEPVIPSTIIFTQRCATAHLLHLLLDELDIPSVPLHSHLTQPQRLESLARFRAREVPVLVTTDVGSRGLDIPSVAMVINWDCPRRADDYVHRVGRTARAGRGGMAVTVVTERDVELVQMIEGEIGAELKELELPEEDVLEKLNEVSVARRIATMAMHDSGFGERAAINKAKKLKGLKQARRKEVA